LLNTFARKTTKSQPANEIIEAQTSDWPKKTARKSTKNQPKSIDNQTFLNSFKNILRNKFNRSEMKNFSDYILNLFKLDKSLALALDIVKLTINTLKKLLIKMELKLSKDQNFSVKKFVHALL